MKEKRILVVDNEEQRRGYLRQLLQERDIEALEAASCEEALQLLAAGSVDLVLTETELPSKSGLYLLQQVKELCPETEVILITHNASSYNLMQALRNGAFDFIFRPIDTGEFLFSALERVFNHIDLRRHNAQLLGELETNNRSLRGALKMAKALNESIERVAATSGIEELFMELLSTSMGETQARRGFLALLDRTSGRLGLKMCEGISPEICRRYAGGVATGLTQAIFRRGKPVLIPGAIPDKLKALADPQEMESLFAGPGLLAAPLRLKERVVGVVVLSGHQNDRAYGEHELNFLNRLCHHAALALEKAGIIHQLKRGKIPPGA